MAWTFIILNKHKMKTINISVKGMSPAGPEIPPGRPHRNDPFRKEEESDPTRIRPGVNEPSKIDPTRIEILPMIPAIPSPGQ